MTLTNEQAAEQYKQAIQDLINKHGGATNVPADEWREVAELTRLYQTINTLEGKVTRRLLSQYMFSPGTIAKVDPSLLEEDISKQSRSDKHKSIYEWLDANTGSTIATQEFADISELSYPTALKFIENNPQYFRKLKRGQYEIRNPKADREEEK
jgi:hypothetical protein